MKATWIVLDGVGVGALPDADQYGDEGSDTLGNVAEALNGLRLPNLQRMGLGNLHTIAGVPPESSPRANTGRMAAASPGKDSTTGHWELAGLVLEDAFPVYPDGFPAEVVERFTESIEREIIGNIAASGTEIIERLGDEHVSTGKPILYTSADSVFQLAAHEDVIPVDTLYAYCAIAREWLSGEHAGGRVIARPFTGSSGRYERTPRRKDFSLEPPGETLLDRMHDASLPVLGVGKVGELFAGRGVTEAIKTASNRDGIDTTIGLMRELNRGLIIANLIDFDTLYGHRNDAVGFARSLEEFDEALNEIAGRMSKDDLLVLTADHGNDPTTPSTDHSREYVPLVVYWPRGRSGVDLGTRESFADLGATLADYFGTQPTPCGRSFLEVIR